MFSRKFCEFFNNTCFVGHVQTPGSKAPVLWSHFKKIGNMKAWMPVALLVSLA